MTHDDARYERPAITDYGTVEEMTAAFDFNGVEDGGNKNTTPHHDDSGTMLP